MRKLLLLVVIFLLTAISKASDLPPYGNTYLANAMFLQQAESSDKKVTLYPNPVTEGILTVTSEESFHFIQIMNITGEIVLNVEYPLGTTSEVLETGKLQKGIYLIRIGFSGKVNFTSKIIVK